MVWTWEWRVKSIGYAHSKDLVHWSEQKEIPLMAGIEGTRNVGSGDLLGWGEKAVAHLVERGRWETRGQSNL